jgi:hypothetical protein
MAATNYTPIQLYFSTTASAVPLAANLAQGELAINITDGKLYYEDNAGVVQVIATKGAGTIGGSTTQIQYNNAGALAGNAAMTFNSGTSTTTLTTLNLTNALGATYGGTAQSSYTQGDILYSSATNTLSKLGIGAVNYILTSSGSVPQWAAPSSITVNTATNLAGGAAGSVPYQSGVATTTFLAIGAADRVMTSTGTAPQWVTSLTGLTGVSSSSITNTSLTSGRVVVSTTAGLQADDADLTFDGTTLSAGGFSTVGLSTLVKTVKIGDSNFNGTAVFAAATPAKLYIGTGTVTDTTSAIGATNAVGAVSSLAITPIAATNTSVTYTNAATLYIAGAPSAGTNVTLTNPYALYVAAGDAYFGGTVTAGTVNLTTLDLTNLEVTNIKAKDGTAAMTIADSTGVVSFTANPVLSGGTANGVLYLNGSKVATSAPSALSFDGTNLGIANASPTYKLDIYNVSGASGGARIYGNDQSNVRLRLENAGSGGIAWELVSGLNGISNAFFSIYNATSSTTALTIDSSNNVGIGLNDASYRLHVSSADTIPAFFTSSATATALVINNTHANAWGSNLSINTQGTAAGYFGTVGSLLGTTTQDLAVWATAGNKFRIYTDGNNLRGIFDNNGNVGFGGQVPPPNTTYPGIFLPYTTNMTSFGGAGNLLYNLYSVGAQLKWQTGSLGGSQFTFGPSSFNWNMNIAGGTADTNASLTQYMLLDTTTGLQVTGNGTFTKDVTAGSSVAATNVNINVNGVANKAKRIIFRSSGTEEWLIGQGAASETSAFEIYNGNGNMTLSINKSTSVSSFGAGVQITSNGVAYASTSAFMVQGFTYTSDFSIANATAQIIGTRMTNDTWNPTLNIVTVRQSLTTGSLSFGGIGFSTIDASNSAGMRDAARIAIVNESTSAVASPTAMAFYTNVGSATQTFPAAEAGRFNSSGSLLLGTISNSTGARLNVVGLRAARFESTQANTAGIVSQCNSANDDEPAISASNINSSGSGVVTFYSSLGGTGASNTNCFHLKAITQGSAIYYLYGNGTSSFTSDARLKKNITTTRDGYAEDLCKLRVVKYNWNGASEGEAQELGLIAQEVEQVFPNLVLDAADEIQGIKPKVLKASVLPFMLLKAIQEQQAIIESLKARLDAANL